MDRLFDNWLAVGLGLVVTLLLGGATLACWNTNRLNEDAAWVAHTHEVLDLTSDALRVLVDAETAERGFVITGQDEYLQPYESATQRLDGVLATLQEKTGDDPSQQERIKRLHELATGRMGLLRDVIALRRQSAEEAQALIASGKGKAQMDAIRELIAAMERTERDLLAKRQRQSGRTYVVAQTSALLTAALGLLMVGAFCWLLRRSLAIRQKAAAVLQEQHERFRTTLASIGDAVIVTDVQGRVTFLNAVAQTLTGWKEEEANGQPLEAVFRIVNEQTRQRVPNPAVRVVQEGVIVGLANHTVLVGKDGTERPIDDSAAPVRDQHGQVAGVVLVFRDVTRRRQAEETLRQQAAQLQAQAEALQDADRRKDEFLATLAHELRNPLAPIRNSVELLRRADGNANLIQQASSMMERQVGQMVRLVDDLLDISRITQGKIQLRKERVELAAVVQSAVEASRPLLEARGHELTVTLPPEPVHLDADPTRLAQVFANLLGNAGKYTDKGGHIWLTAERQGQEAIVSVRDTGIGIAAEHLPRLFEMFSQVEPVLERSQGGLGIGLALVRGLVQLHGGTIEARSGGIGMGSEFLVRLPVVDAPVRPAPQEPSEGGREPRSGARCRILVVDDNPDAADSLAMMLRLLGHDIEMAHDGLEAVQAAAAFRPDVVLLDIGLPKLNGYEAARRIREQPWAKQTILVAVTGWGQEEDKRRATEAGFDHHLTKPAEPAALEKLLAVFNRVCHS